MYREVQFELADGKSATPLFETLRRDPRGRTRLQALTVTSETATVLFDCTGSDDALARLRAILQSNAQPCLLHADVIVDEPKRLRFIITWTRPRDPSREGVSLEHILHDTAGAGALLFGRVEAGTIMYKAASPGGRGLTAFLEAAQRAFGARFRVHPVRAGIFRAGWEIEEGESVQPEDEALLSAALQAGYYDEPKRCGVRELGDALGVSKSVVARRLRDLERRALERMVS